VSDTGRVSLATSLRMPSADCIVTNMLQAPVPLPPPVGGMRASARPGPMVPMLDLLCRLVKEDRFGALRSNALHCIRLVCAASAQSRQQVEELLPEFLGATSSLLTGGPSPQRAEILRRKRQAKERQAAILRRFAMQQAAFDDGAGEAEAEAATAPSTGSSAAPSPMPTPPIGPADAHSAVPLSPRLPASMTPPRSPRVLDAVTPPPVGGCRTCALCHDEMRVGEAVGLLALAQRASVVLPRLPPPATTPWCKARDTAKQPRPEPSKSLPTKVSDPHPHRSGPVSIGPPAALGTAPAVPTPAPSAAPAADRYAAEAADEDDDGIADTASDTDGRESDVFVRTDDLMGDYAETVLQNVVQIMHHQQDADRRLDASIVPRDADLSGVLTASAETTVFEWLASPTGAYGLHIRSCGHEMHEVCLSRCLGALRLEGAGLDDTEWTCPVCRRIANLLLPINASGVPASAPSMPEQRQFEGAVGVQQMPPPPAVQGGLRDWLGSAAWNRQSVTRRVSDAEQQPGVDAASTGTLVAPGQAPCLHVPVADPSVVDDAGSSASVARAKQLSAFGKRVRELIGTESKRLLRPLPLPALGEATVPALLTSSITSTCAVLANPPAPADPSYIRSSVPTWSDTLASASALVRLPAAQTESLTALVGCARSLADCAAGDALRKQLTCLLSGEGPGGLAGQPDGASSTASLILALEPFTLFAASLTLWPAARWAQHTERSRLIHTCVALGATQVLMCSSAIADVAGASPLEAPADAERPDWPLQQLAKMIALSAVDLRRGDAAFTEYMEADGSDAVEDTRWRVGRLQAAASTVQGIGAPPMTWESALSLVLPQLLRRMVVLTQAAGLFSKDDDPASRLHALEAHNEGTPSDVGELEVLCHLLNLGAPLDVLRSVAPDLCTALSVPLTASARNGITDRCLAFCSIRPTNAPTFITLPHSFSELYNAFVRRKCSYCGTVPMQPACCLLCGALVCTGGSCCRMDGDDEAVRHAAACGHGVGAFIAVRITSTLVIVGRRYCWWGSLYLDAHGEEDRGLTRGRPLLLAPGRLRELEAIWRSNALRELLHNNQPPFPHLMLRRQLPL